MTAENRNKLELVDISAEEETQICIQRYPRKARIVFYSHDTMGLGHVRRNLLIAQVLSTCGVAPDILLISGAWETSSFLMPPGVDCLILPALYKEQSGDYRSRRLSIPLPDIISLREQIIYAAVSDFKPDVLIVDNVPRGVSHELDITLKYLRSHTAARCVLGLRDVLDEVGVVQSEWNQHKNYETVLNCYDEVWIYGDPAIYDAVKEYGYPPEISSKIRYTGYLDQRVRLKFIGRPGSGMPCPDICVPGNSFVLCMVGGGQDGYQLAEAFVRADFPSGVKGILLTGPHMDSSQGERLFRYAAQKSHSQFRIYEFIPEPTVLLEYAECVISMGGYNSVSEILSFGKPTLIMPRVTPRKEQLIRAMRLKDIGIIEMLEPEQLNVQALSAWIRGKIGHPHQEFRGRIDMKGLRRIPRFLLELLQKS